MSLSPVDAVAVAVCRRRFARLHQLTQQKTQRNKDMEINPETFRSLRSTTTSQGLTESECARSQPNLRPKSLAARPRSACACAVLAVHMFCIRGAPGEGEGEGEGV